MESEQREQRKQTMRVTSRYESANDIKVIYRKKSAQSRREEAEVKLSVAVYGT